MDVLLDYLGKDGSVTLAYEDRGMTMVDLVDVLGWHGLPGHVLPSEVY